MLPLFSHLDEGNEAADLKGSLFSENCGVRREVFEKVGLFRTDLGPGAIGLGDDTEFGLRAAAAGFQAVYVPEALAYPLIPPERTRRSVFLRRCYISGLSQPLFRDYKESIVRMLLYFGRTAAMRLAAGASASDSARQMAELSGSAEHMGRVVQIIRQKLHRWLAPIHQSHRSNIQC